MHDIQFIREKPQEFDAHMTRRGARACSTEILEIDEKRRALQTDIQGWQSERNDLSKKIGQLMGQGKKDEAEEAKEKVAGLKDKLATAEEQEAVLAEKLNEYLISLPNLLHADVPDGEDDDANIEIFKWGEPTKFDFIPKDHVELGEALGMLDFETAAKISGSRFTLMKGALAQLERAVQQYCLDVNTKEFGYTEVSSPILVKEEAMFGTGQLPKFGEDSFQTNTGHWLIATSEISLTNMVRESILNHEELPLRYTALTPCFRSEAGSAGRDTRGMFRVHQFWKVELVSITTPTQSEEEHERMTKIEETLMQRLGIPYRKVLQCTGDIGFSSMKTFDIEGWFPGQNMYRELTSCSNCGDFQARRMKARFRRPDEKKTEFVHTLNGSALSTTRFMVALIENYQNADGSITVPEVLRPYMGDLDVIKK